MGDDVVLAGVHFQHDDEDGWIVVTGDGQLAGDGGQVVRVVMMDAALDEIERLRAENEALRAALAVKDNHDHFDCTAEREVLRLENQRLQALIDAYAAMEPDAEEALLAAATKGADRA